MKKKVFTLLIIVMSLSLAGIIFVQVYWINKAVDSKEAQFSFNARQSLIKVAERVKDKEIDEYYVKYVNIADSIELPKTAVFSRLFHVEQNDLTNQTFLLTNSILQEDYKVSSEIPGSEQDSIKFKKITHQKLTVVRKEDLSKEMSLSSREKYRRVSRMKDREKTIVFDAIKGMLAKLPVYERVDKEELRKLIDQQLTMRSINSDYEFGIYSDGLATKVVTDHFNRDSPASYGVSILPYPNTNYKLYINFKEKKQEILSSIFWMAALSVIFTGIIIVAYAGAIYQLIKQRRIDEIKTDFINNMTHEFKTPIATINLALDSASNPKIAGDPVRVKNYLRMIRDENHRMHAQVENVLRISKLERNELDLKKNRVGLHGLVEEAMTHVSLIVENRNGYIKTHFGALKCTILANEGYFVNVIINILDNAIKYSEESPKIDIFTENVKSYILLKISDQGNGMNKAVQKKIFEKFYREHTGDIHNIKGHGLGLAYVKKIVEDHQGEISVESEKGKGSTFIIKLPLIS